MQHRKLLKGLNKVMFCSGCHTGDQVRGYCHSPEHVVRKKHVLDLPRRQTRFSARLALGGKREEVGNEYRGFGYERRGVEMGGSHEFECGCASCYGGC